MKQLLTRIKAHIPRPLPRGLAEFHAFCDEVFELFDIPDHPSYRKAVSQMLIQRCHTHKVSIHQIGCALKKAECDEVCHAYMDELIKEKKKEALSIKAAMETQLHGDQ